MRPHDQRLPQSVRTFFTCVWFCRPASTPKCRTFAFGVLRSRPTIYRSSLQRSPGRKCRVAPSSRWLGSLSKLHSLASHVPRGHQDREGYAETSGVPFWQYRPWNMFPSSGSVISAFTREHTRENIVEATTYEDREIHHGRTLKGASAPTVSPIRLATAVANHLDELHTAATKGSRHGKLGCALGDESGHWHLRIELLAPDPLPQDFDSLA